jgi:hypothetical protein
MAEKEKIPMDGGQCHQNDITLENNKGRTRVPTFFRKVTGKMNVPNGHG